MTTIKFDKLLWSPYHEEYGYASGKMHTIVYDSKEECDKVCEQYNLELEVRKEIHPKYNHGFYMPLPFIRSIDLLDAVIETE